MKIKQEKQLNLPQLIEYAWDNNVENKEYPCDGFEDKTVIFNGMGWAEFSDEYSYNLTDTFTVEVEEDITEDTVFNYLLLTYKKDNDKIETHWYENKCKKSVLSQSDSLMYVSEQLSITYFDDKGIPHLIWTHEKGMVEQMNKLRAWLSSDKRFANRSIELVDDYTKYLLKE